MATMRNLSFLLLAVLLGACAPAPTALPEHRAFTPYQTATASPTSTPLPFQTAEVIPTPTPMLYTVRLNDTLAGIAARYGVTVEALLAANPGVRPTALTVGSQLVIPLGSVPVDPTPTPLPLAVWSPKCWPEAGGGLWCLAVVRNEYDETLENLAALFTLLDAQGQEQAAQIAYAPLNILPPGQAMPLGVHFAPPVALPAEVRVQVLTAIRLLPGDARYLRATLDNLTVALDASGRLARLVGRVVLEEERSAAQVWVLAVAYDAGGTPVGYRRWEAQEPLAAGESLTFTFTLASLGPPIARVEFLVEARP